MKKTNKVIDLFSKNKVIQNNQAKYSEALNDFIKPYENDFPKDYDLVDILEFAIHAWNFANIKEEMPSEDFDKTLLPSQGLGNEKVIFDKMLEQKIAKFANYDRYIVDFDLKEDNNGKLLLTVMASDLEGFLESVEQKFLNQQDQEDFDESYIDRYAISIKPQQPFLDWINNLYPDSQILDIKEASIYLVDDGIKDLEKWLAKKYDKFFTFELYEYHTNKKEWPQKRSYKMFKKWFQVNISTMVYDLEKRPVLKG